MQCPYCGEEMERGNLKTEGGSGLYYLPDGEEFGLFSTHKQVKKKGGVILDGPFKTRLHYTSISCYACKACQKIIVSY